jgi:hypothetical protein
MTQRPIHPTDPDEEMSKGRIALWLDPGDIEYLAKHFRCWGGADEEERERCSRICFRANAALHKAGQRKNATDEEGSE